MTAVILEGATAHHSGTISIVSTVDGTSGVTWCVCGVAGRSGPCPVGHGEPWDVLEPKAGERKKSLEAGPGSLLWAGMLDRFQWRMVLLPSP